VHDRKDAVLLRLRQLAPVQARHAVFAHARPASTMPTVAARAARPVFHTHWTMVARPGLRRHWLRGGSTAGGQRGQAEDECGNMIAFHD
jgi:hypothetical protein